MLFKTKHTSLITPTIFPMQQLHLELQHTKNFFFWYCQRVSSKLGNHFWKVVGYSSSPSGSTPLRQGHLSSYVASCAAFRVTFDVCWLFGGREVVGGISSSTAVSALSALLQFNCTVRSCSKTSRSPQKYRQEYSQQLQQSSWFTQIFHGLFQDSNIFFFVVTKAVSGRSNMPLKVWIKKTRK